jgi:hypothetical protein
MPSLAEIDKIPVEDSGVMPAGLPESDRGIESARGRFDFDSVRDWVDFFLVR